MSQNHSEKKSSSSQFLKTDGGKTKSNAIEIPSISLPNGGGAIKGIDEKFSVNAINGSSSFSIPLPFSPARGASPSLSLSYNSGGGNSIFGLGWNIGLSSIKRKTDKGLPQYFDGIDSDTFLFSEAEDLVPTYEKVDGEFSLDNNGEYKIHEKTDLLNVIRFYKPRIEGLFARIERWTEKANGRIKWRVITKDNITTLFGWTDNATIANPKDATKIYEWLPEFVFDDKGNCSQYVYKAEDEKGFDTSLLHNRNRLDSTGKITYTNCYLHKVLAGDRLSIQLKELETNYMKLNKREFELTKSISLRLLDPEKLVELIRTGKCENLVLPDWLFNLEFADENLYAMRLKSIAVSVPCITGPQTSTNVKLKILKSWIGWSETDTFDFTNSPSLNEEIITSSAVNDAAVFEMNLRDERYMPFENQGVVSEWEISLPNQHEFDYSTIIDLVLHVRYVAKGKSRSITSAPMPPPDQRNIALKYSEQVMSLKHDFPQEWHVILSNQISSTNALSKLLSSNFLPSLAIQHIPYRMRLAGITEGTITKLFYTYMNTDKEILVKEVPTEQLEINNFEMKIGSNKVEDIWILYHY